MKTITCECGGKTAIEKSPYAVYGIKVGDFPAMVCGKCGRKYFDEKTAVEIELREQALGVWGLEAETKIGKVGDSLDIKINSKLAKFLKLKKGQKVRIFPEGKNAIMVELC